jgi:two-component system nitrate/nitrite sensor histidine kinase NarX
VSELSDIENVLESALIEARHAITTLRAEPEGTSTADAIEAYAEEFAQVSSLRVALEREPFVPEVGAKGRVELLRVVQEALNNVRKHANAREVHIRLRPSEGGILVAIEDDGTGFDIDTTPDGHFGLQIMRERMESIGGTLDIRSQPHVGTEVEVWVPVREAEEEREALTSGLA